MTITNKPALPGTKALAQRAPVAAGTSSTVPVVLAGVPDAAANGNLAIGRSGQVGIVDRFDLHSIVRGGLAAIAYLRDSDYDNDATAGSTSVMLDLPLNLTGYNATTNTTRWTDIRIDDFGYVLRCDDTRVDDPGGTPNIAADGYRQFPRKLSLIQFAGAAENSLDAYLKMRYLEKASAERHGVVRGAWSGNANTTGSSFALLAAPGSGLHYRIRTIVLIGSGGSTPSHRITLGANATPANAPLKEFYSSPGEDGYSIKYIGTNLDIPTPDNTPIYWSWDSDFNARATILIGCEVIPTALSNHLNLTGIPQ